MEVYITQQIMNAYDNAINDEAARIAAGKSKYNDWFGTTAKRRLYGRYMETINTLLETTISKVTGKTYADCIVTY